MDHEELMELILDHYKNPRHYGVTEGADIIQEGGNPGCGDLITIYLDVDDEGVIRRASFEGEGCMVSQAGTSILLEAVEGKTVEEVEAMPSGVISEALGRKLITTRPKCAHLGFNTLKAAVKFWKMKEVSDSIKRESRGS